MGGDRPLFETYVVLFFGVISLLNHRGIINPGVVAAFRKNTILSVHALLLATGKLYLGAAKSNNLWQFFSITAPGKRH